MNRFFFEWLLKFYFKNEHIQFYQRENQDIFCQICALLTNSISINRQNCMSKTVKVLKVYLNKPSSWMSEVCIFSQCFLWSASYYPYYSCLISINPTQEILELIFDIFAFFINTLSIGIWILCPKICPIRHVDLERPWAGIWKRTPILSASLMGAGMCMPKRLTKFSVLPWSDF